MIQYNISKCESLGYRATVTGVPAAGYGKTIEDAIHELLLCYFMFNKKSLITMEVYNGR